VTLLTRELVRLRARLHSVESQMLDASFASIIGGPNELPAPELDGGGGGGVIPIPRPDPELPVGPSLSRFARDIASLQGQMKALDSKLTRSFNSLKETIIAMKP
jgi:hypothetical protein